jgi:hypothetical protein
MLTSSINSSVAVNPTFSWIAPWFSRLVMTPPVIIMTLIALRYIRNPIHAASSTGVALTTPEALTDTRVVGALALTIAFAIGGSIVSMSSLRLGHATVIALMGFILAVRFFGFSADGTTLAMGDQKVKVVGELVFLALNALGFFFQTYLQANR